MNNVHYLGVSENSVPLNPLVLLIMIPFFNGYFIGKINPTFSDKPIWGMLSSPLNLCIDRACWDQHGHTVRRKPWEFAWFQSGPGSGGCGNLEMFLL